MVPPASALGEFPVVIVNDLLHATFGPPERSRARATLTIPTLEEDDMAVKTLPDIDYLHECFEYDPDSGSLTWRRRPERHFSNPRAAKRTNARFAGKPAGSVTKLGYRSIKLYFVKYLAHRIIWKMVTGCELPEIDHKNRVGLDLKWDNLRAANRSQNNANTSATRKRPRSDLPRGVSMTKGRFRARIHFQRVEYHLGLFNSAEEARAVYELKAREMFGEFYNAARPSVAGL